jgi:hypothetical protein
LRVYVENLEGYLTHAYQILARSSGLT